MSGIECFVGGIALLGPGLPGWAASQAVLSGSEPWQDTPVTIPPPAMLAPVERRRTSLVVRLALAVSAEAVGDTGLEAEGLDTVFASSNGDGAVVGAILDALAISEGAVSPTQFHNSVHNAAAGYWGIGARSTRPSISLGCHRDSFPMGLLHAASQVAGRGVPVLFCAYDAPLPEPLAPLHPTDFPFAMACVLTPERLPCSRARLTLQYVPTADDAVDPPSAWEEMERGNPAARSLPLLAALAAGRARTVALPLLDGGRLDIEVSP
ncbi:beta-ketoacyl synthase domain protein [Acetobacteraceae bacterium AT-5844]|nr:beta-ketoacyl synthase domain protein [Acetobacteraceae bacterium AT-5844]